MKLFTGLLLLGNIMQAHNENDILAYASNRTDFTYLNLTAMPMDSTGIYFNMPEQDNLYYADPINNIVNCANLNVDEQIQTIQSMEATNTFHNLSSAFVLPDYCTNINSHPHENNNDQYPLTDQSGFQYLPIVPSSFDFNQHLTIENQKENNIKKLYEDNTNMNTLSNDNTNYIAPTLNCTNDMVTAHYIIHMAPIEKETNSGIEYAQNTDIQDNLYQDQLNAFSVTTNNDKQKVVDVNASSHFERTYNTPKDNREEHTHANPPSTSKNTVDALKIKNDILVSHQEPRFDKNIAESISMVSTLDNTPGKSSDMQNKHTDFVLLFDEKRFRGLEKTVLEYQEYKLQLDYNTNIVGIENKNKEINKGLLIFLIRLVAANNRRDFFANILKDSIIDKNNSMLSFDTGLIAPITLYLIQVFSNKYNATNRITSNTPIALLKSLFYPMYPLYKMLNFTECSEETTNFFRDFIIIFENLVFLKDILHSSTAEEYEKYQSYLNNDYEILKQKFRHLNPKNPEITQIEHASDCVKKMKDLIHNINIVSTVFEINLQGSGLYWQSSLKNLVYSASLRRKNICDLLYNIGYRFLDSDQKKKLHSNINNLTLGIYNKKNTIDLDMEHLVLSLIKNIKLHTILQTVIGTKLLIKRVAKNYSIIKKSIKYTTDILKKSSEERYNLVLLTINTKDINLQIFKLRLYNLSLLIIIYSFETYGQYIQEYIGVLPSV